VAEAQVVAGELVRVAILWNEAWHDGLEEASRRYSDRDFDGMLAILAPMHAQLTEVCWI
jgi:FKBP12-rapamycin complex-associated protein